MRRTRSLLAAVAVIGLLGACGTQVADSKRRALAAAQLRQGTAAGSGPVTGVQPGTSTALPGDTGVLPDPTTVTGGGQTATGGGSGTTTTTTGGGKTKPGKSGGKTTSGEVSGIGAPAPAGGNGGATDVGVTATQILLGNVADLSGPQPGLFQSAVNGTNAYLAYINSLGGIYGRQLKVDVADSQTTCEGDRNGHQQLITKVFAFSGSFALNDQCGATVLAQHKNVPDAHIAVTPSANALPNNFSVDPVGSTVNTGPFALIAQKYGHAKVQHVGFLWANLPAVNNVAALSIKAGEKVGWNFIVHQSVSPTSTDFTPQIIQMRQRGVQVFYTLFDAQELAEFVRNANQQNFHPLIVAPLVYDQTFFQQLGGAALANGIIGFNGATLFFSKADAQNIPSVALFQKWYAAVTHNGPADTFAADAWSETELLVNAIAAAGPDLTRLKVLAELRKVHSFDANGFFAPADPADKKAGTCFVPWIIKNGEYLRTDTSPTKFRCQGAQG
ncbi:MAG TPA: ABC transporter substrate-binding protein [Mycobacteriales bacterium]|nr:ABC transporter substrate-binding protein [Mycobacteriales bacterium]